MFLVQSLGSADQHVQNQSSSSVLQISPLLRDLLICSDSFFIMISVPSPLYVKVKKSKPSFSNRAARIPFDSLSSGLVPSLGYKCRVYLGQGSQCPVS